MKRTKTISYRMTIMFTIFFLVVLTSIGISTYVNQNRIVEEQTLDNMKDVCEYLENLMQLEGEDFIAYQEIFFERFTDISLPMDFTSYRPYEKDFIKLFGERYPGKTLGKDVSFADLDDDVKDAYLLYKQAYWIQAFEEAVEPFDLTYTYYLVPHENVESMSYVIDCERTSRADGDEYVNEMNPELNHYQGVEDDVIYLNIELFYVDEKYQLMWDVWSGKQQDVFHVWHNDFGDTYSYYLPLTINGQRLGMIAADIDIANVNSAILSNTLMQVLTYAVIFFLATAILIYLINRFYVSKIVALKNSVEKYTDSKDVAVVDEIWKNTEGDDEIATLSDKIILMILEIKNYTENLIKANEDVSRLDALANQDSLTGLRNRLAYENEIKKINRQIAKGDAEFGVAMIDMNYLKEINDNYGHEKGNEALINVSKMVCDCFKHSKVFRIGGDEFVAILMNNDLENVSQCRQELEAQITGIQKDLTLHPWERVSVSIGVAIYDKDRHQDFQSVFEEADRLMYEDKEKQHAVRKN